MLKVLEILNIVLAALVGGMYWGPWLALTISLKKLELNVFLAVARRLNHNMSGLMTVLTPLSLLAGIPVLLLAYPEQPSLFWLTLTGSLCFLLALVVTVAIEAPIVKQVITWTEATLPPDWEQLRNRWSRFHVIRVGAGLAGLVCMVTGALW